MNIHEKVRAKIEAEVPCYAQGIIGGRTVSYHPDFTGFGMTYSDKFSASDMTTTAVSSC